MSEKEPAAGKEPRMVPWVVASLLVLEATWPLLVLLVMWRFWR
jgi:hypothetical protein